MKQAYLLETIKPLYRMWRKTFSFVRYHYGPFSDDVFHRVDTLVFNGLVSVSAFAISPQRVEARYRIAQAGRAALSGLQSNDIKRLAVDLVWALQALGADHASKITRLVYQEPGFARVFADHAEKGIQAHEQVPLPAVTDANNATMTALSILQSVIRTEEGETNRVISTRSAVKLFLDFLALSARGTARTGIAR
jgi:hypothetical protein